MLATGLTAALLLARPWSASLAARSSLIPADTSLGLIGHAVLALGFIAPSSLETVRADLLGYLFGDVLALSTNNLAPIGVLGAAALGALTMIWRPLLADAISPEILAPEAGAARGIRDQGIFLALVAGLIAFGLKVVGVRSLSPRSSLFRPPPPGPSRERPKPWQSWRRRSARWQRP